LAPGIDAGASATSEPEPTTDLEYVVQPGDVLRVHARRLRPRPCHPIAPFDVLVVCVVGTPRDRPIWGAFPVTPRGTIELGFDYGTISVGGLTLDRTVAAIRGVLKLTMEDPQIALLLAESDTMARLAAEHVVSPNGTVHLGAYGSVKVGGLKIWQATAVIDQFVSKFLCVPEVSLSAVPSGSLHATVSE
jgi:protein involved in polysaccharide export with SLBB domain